PFGVSYGTREMRQAFWIRLAGDEGSGEGTIPPYYHVDQSAMIDCWRRAAQQTTPFPDSIEGIDSWISSGPAPARSAIDLALHDRVAKRQGVPLHVLLGLPAPKPLPTSFTISI